MNDDGAAEGGEEIGEEVGGFVPGFQKVCGLGHVRLFWCGGQDF